jgi:transposase, IS30 family
VVGRAGPGRPGPLRDVVARFWGGVRAGLSVPDAARGVGVSVRAGQRWFTEAGGVAPRCSESSGRYLSLAEREVIDELWADPTVSKAAIARLLGRHRSTIGRELARNQTVGRAPRPPLPDRRRRKPGPRPGGLARYERLRYRAAHAQAQAEQTARRPKPGKIATTPRLQAAVTAGLDTRWSPQQIARRLRRDHPDRPELQVSHETIYQALYVQGRGGLRRELTACLRTGRAVRRPHRRPDERRGRIPNMVMISERPAEAADRAVPGHWEGDLIVGAQGRSAIGTLVERSTRFVLLLHLPARHDAAAVRDAMITAMAGLPVALRRSLTWDQGAEMARHGEIKTAMDLPIYFCDPHSPWQRGSNENTNGLLRQYFPKGTDLSVHSAEHLAAVAAELNGRPRETLGWDTPAEALSRLLSTPSTGDVASTT